MKLILQKDVKNLGKAGDQVSVKNGFARNFLIPRGYALILNKNRLKEWNHQKVIIEAKKRKAGSERQILIDKLSSIKLLFEKESQKDNKIFGSVSAHDISQALEEEHNISVDKKDIHFDELKTVGDHKISIRLSSEHKTEILLTIKGKLRKSKEEKPAEKQNQQIESSIALSEKENQLSSESKTEDSTKIKEEKVKPEDISNQNKNITAEAQSTKKAMTNPEELKNSEVDKKENEQKTEKPIKVKEQKTEELKNSQANEKIEEIKQTETAKTSPDLKKSKTEEPNKSAKTTSQEKPTEIKEDKKSSGLLGKLFSSKK